MTGFGISSAARSFLRLGNRWGTLGGSTVRGLLNYVVPVTVVERFRDEDEGSLLGLTAFTTGAGTVPGGDVEFPAVSFFSIDQAWELHRINVSFRRIAPKTTIGGNYRELVMMYVPFAPYDPTLNNTLGFFTPGLVTKSPFVSGSVFGVSGTNPLLPTQPEGFMLNHSSVRASDIVKAMQGDSAGYIYSSGGVERLRIDEMRLQNTMQFDDPPLRIPRNYILTIQRQELPSSFTFVLPAALEVSILYNLIEDRRGTPAAGNP